MKRASLLTAVIVLLALCVNSQKMPHWAQVISAGGAGNDYGVGVATDSAGNTYVCGGITGTAWFGNFMLTNDGPGIYVAKYLRNGSLDWIRKASGSQEIYPAGIGLDSLGNIVIGGSFAGKARFGQDTFNSTGQCDAFLAKYDNQGNQLWAKDVATHSNVRLEFGLSVDAAGYIYLASGSGYYDLWVDSIHLPNVSSFVSKFDASGNVIWAKGIKYATLEDVVPDKWGNLVIIGNFKDSVRFGTQLLSSAGHTYDTYIARYSSTGNFLWAKLIGSRTWDDFGTSVAVDGSGNIFTTGTSGDSSVFGSTVTYAKNGDDIYIAKYDSSGNALWVRTAIGNEFLNGYELSIAIVTDDAGNAYLTGEFKDTIYFGNILLPVPYKFQGHSTFVAKYDAAGNVVWAVNPLNNISGSTAPNGSDIGYGLCITPSGDVLVTGEYSLIATFGSQILQSAGGEDMFLARLSTATGITQSPTPAITTLYPNPATGTLHIRYTGSFTEVSLFDATGKMVYARPLAAAGYAELELGNLPDAIYIVRLSGKDGSVSRSIALHH